MENPLCFVLMPFGQKTDSAGTTIDFDSVYQEVIAPGIRDADLEPVRADEEMTGGIIHKPMFERLILCDFAVADLTTANANVFYELGVRHAVRPWSTVLLFARGGSQLPFDVGPLRAMPYMLSPEGKPAQADAIRSLVAGRLREARKAAGDEPAKDSPLFQLVDGYPDVARLKIDVFRDRVRHSEQQKQRVAHARRQGLAALRDLEPELGELNKLEAGVVVDLFRSYRAVKGYEEMVDLVKRMPRPLAKTVMVQEQLAFALNRLAVSRDGPAVRLVRPDLSEDAERILQVLIEERGPSSETYGLLGRVYKDRWEACLSGGDLFEAEGLLDLAVDAYRRGFEADWRDAYPGINLVTLMEVMNPPDPDRERIRPVVEYAARQRLAGKQPDYWDYATLVELGVLKQAQAEAESALRRVLPMIREQWEPETTARNLRLVREGRARRGESVPWADAIEQQLEKKARAAATPLPVG